MTNKASNTGRKNHSRQANFSQKSLNNPFGEGTFRYVALGEYKTGLRAGQPCVGKFFKAGSCYEKSYYDADMEVTEKAVEVVSLWNNEKIISQMVQVNVPEVWTFDKSSNVKFSGTKLLIEPYVTNFQKFNSNSGWNDTSFNWGQAMQALSHFSYHISGGKVLLCDLQGGVDHKGATLTDPVIISNDHTGKYGPTDLGPSGITNFFAYHKCNGYCRRHWILPKGRQQSMKLRKGTTMVRFDSRKQGSTRGVPGATKYCTPITSSKNISGPSSTKYKPLYPPTRATSRNVVR